MMDNEYYFEPINDVGFWIYDNKLQSFVRLKRTHKSAWAKSHHAKSAFANACWTLIWEQNRYEVRKF